jgi:hypothetical protein
MCLLGENWKPWEKTNKRFKPKHFKPWKPKGDTVPDYWIPPEKSRILEIKAFEMVSSTEFSAQKCLRFPRIHKPRPDKDWHECLSIKDLKKLWDDTREGNLMRHGGSCTSAAALEGGGRTKRMGHRKKTRNTTTVRRGLRGVGTMFRPPSENSLLREEERGNAFENLEFCVMDHKYPPMNSEEGKYAYLRKADIERFVRNNGAALVQNPVQASTSYIVAAKKDTLRVSSIIKTGTYNVISVQWLYRCVNRGEVSSPRFSDFLFFTDQMRKCLEEKCDEYGDSYTEHTTSDQLVSVFHSVAQVHANDFAPRGPPRLSSIKIREWKWTDEEISALDTPWNIFSRCRVYLHVGDESHKALRSSDNQTGEVPQMESVNKSLQTLRLEFASKRMHLYGAKILRTFDPLTTTHILTDANADTTLGLQKAFELLELIRRTKERVMASGETGNILTLQQRVVNMAWVKECCDKKKYVVLDEEESSRFTVNIERAASRFLELKGRRK